ncbi:MAG: DNA mismatch repair protein MutS, partial [Clostridia bacterium]|nr:DNA mismatch repair protein MutS [Clostridia bacterium]
NEDEINARLDAVAELVDDIVMREELKTVLSFVQDIERKCSKISAGTINPKECLALADTLSKFPDIKTLLYNASSKKLCDLNGRIFEFFDVVDLINRAIAPDASTIMKDGGYIKEGFSSELDIARMAGTNGLEWLAEFEQKEKERTGIKNLKIKFNKVFGYYIEVTSSQLSLVPDDYIQKQVTTTCERFITPELKDMEYKILHSQEESLVIESKLYAEIKEHLAGFIGEMLESADAIAELDVLLSFAIVSNKNNYVRPTINSSVNCINISNGRHPVVESLIDGGTFSPNDTNLDSDENRTMLITGPNMAGKSTYMRQVAIITLMAHMGCFVPADSAEIAITDRVFTRVGASDDLAFGQSTFMVEMIEVANIVQNATDKSLIILDEVGRGTSTYDGLSIAWAIMEYLSKHLKAKTLFATHYHELCDLEGKVDGVKNYRVMVKEFGGSVIFLHKIARGSANRSFGIEVAGLAGLPEELITRAKEILAHVESGQKGFGKNGENQSKPQANFNYDEVINILKEMDMNTISPIMAFGTLQNLVDKVKK